MRNEREFTVVLRIPEDDGDRAADRLQVAALRQLANEHEGVWFGDIFPDTGKAELSNHRVTATWTTRHIQIPSDEHSDLGLPADPSKKHDLGGIGDC